MQNPKSFTIIILNIQQYKLQVQMSLFDKLQKALPKQKLDFFGKQSLMNSSIPYYLLSILPATAIILRIPNPCIYIVLIYAVIPLMDEFFSLDSRNPNEQERKKLEKRDPEFRFTLYLAMVMLQASFFKMMSFFTTVELNNDTVFEYIGVIFIFTNFYSTQFAIAHELMHKPGKFYRVLATIHMSKLYYMHWTTSHLDYHHAYIGTDNDPSTPKRGQTLYAFLKKCIIVQWIQIYQDQKKRGLSILQNEAALSIFAIAIISDRPNRIMNILVKKDKIDDIFITTDLFWELRTTLYIFKKIKQQSFGFFSTALLYFYSFKHFVLHSIMAIGAIVYLQAITYIEHYGLKRKLLQNGQYEKVSIMHSWNAPHRFTNYLLFKLQRHSDHHQNSSKPFQTLASVQQSPFLPHGYSLMILMAFFPRIWFKVMNPLADEYGKLIINDNGKIDPSVKEQSAKQTRKFLVKTCVGCGLMLLISVLAKYCQV